MVLGGLQLFGAFEQARQQREAVAAAQEEAKGYLTEGRDAGLQSLQAGQDRALGIYDYAGQQSRDALSQGLAGAEGALAGGPYNVLGGPSRLGAMLDKGFDLQADEGFQFRQQQGEDAIKRQAAAQGGGQVSGRTLGALASFNSNLAAQEAQAAFSRYATQAGLAGQADAMQNQLLTNQAGRADNFALQRAGYRFGTGQGIAGIYGNVGAQQGGAVLGTASGTAGLHMGTAQDLGTNAFASANLAGSEWGAMIQQHNSNRQFVGGMLSSMYGGGR